MSFIFLLPNTDVSAGTDYSTIRVNISISKTSIPIVIDGEYIISEDPSINLSRGSYTLSVSNSNKVRIKGNGIDKVIGSSITFTRLAYDGSGNNHLTLKGTDYGNRDYLGNMKFTVDSGKLFVVNHIPLEEYLYGVVAYEMSNSFPLEALKAQAVGARGYAVKKIKTSGTYDVLDTTYHQVYKGYDPSLKRVIQAVNETKGKVLMYNGKIIESFYAASNGGYTELSGNVWSTNYPYYKIKEDPYDLENPASPYQKIFVPENVVGSKYDAITSDIAGDYIVQIVNVNEFCNIRSGPGTSYSKIGTADLGTNYTWISSTTNSSDETWHKIDFGGNDGYVRSDIGKKMANGRFIYENLVLTDLQAKAYDQIKDKTASATDIKIISVNSLNNGKEQWPNTGSKSYVTADANVTLQYYAKGSSSLSSNTNLNLELQLMTPSGTGYTRTHDYLNSDYRLRGVEGASGGYYITNGRYGHGIGMSQRGAQTMANKYNWKYDKILSFYYVGTQLTSVDTTIPVLPNPGNIPKITSGKYKIGSSDITGLSTNLNVSTFLSNTKVENGSVQLVSAKGDVKNSGNIATGDKLQLRSQGSNSVYKSYDIVIYGDVNGDGKISLIDLLHIQRHLLNTSKVSGVYAKAADVSKDGRIALIDLLMVQRQLLGTANIKQ
jgi:peptidoglycan hydrolase-like amidase